MYLLKIFRLKNLSLKRLLFFNLGLLSLFLILYELFFSDLLSYFYLSKDTVDINYYNNIFDNTHISIGLILLLILFSTIFFSKIKKIFIKSRFNTFILWIFSISILTHLMIIILVDNKPISDSKYYIFYANQLYQYGKYINEAGDFTAFWPVGLPFLLNLFQTVFGNPYLLIYKIFSIFTFHLYAYILLRLFEEYLTVSQLKLFVFVFLFFPNNLFSSNVILTDYLFAFLMFLSIYLTNKTKLNINLALIVIGITIGIATYIRPNGLLLAFFICFAYLRGKKLSTYFKPLIITFSICLLTILPWTIRNYIHFNSIIFVSSNGGFNFLMGNHIQSSGKVNFDFDYSYNKPEAIANKEAFQKSLNDIFENPLKSGLRIFKKIIFTYLRGDSSITWSFKETNNSIHPIIVSFLFFLTNLYYYNIIIVSLFIILSTRFHYHNTCFFKSFFPIFFYVYILIVLFYGGERYILPALPFHFYFFSKTFNDKESVHKK